MIVAVNAVHLVGIGPAELAWAFAVEDQAAGCPIVAAQPTGSTWRAPNVIIEAADGLASGQLDHVPPMRRPVPDLGLSHLCIQCRDLDVGLAVAQMAQFREIHGPTALGTGYLYLYAHGASGMLVEMEGAPFAPLDMPTFWIGHVAWSAQDGAALAAFYGALLARPVTASSRLRGQELFDQVVGLPDVDLEGWWVPGLNVGLEFWQFHNPRSVRRWTGPGPGSVVFSSDDLEADSARACALGARPYPPDADQDRAAADIGSGRVSQFLDPEGNRFDLVAATAEGQKWVDDPGLLVRLASLHPAQRASGTQEGA